MVAGCAGADETETASERDVPEPQLLDAATEILPDVAPTVTVMELVVEEPVQPEGNVHVYPVAPAIAVTEYVCAVEAQTDILPVIADG